MYKVISTAAPVYKDHNMSFKKGFAGLGATFESERWDKNDAGGDMVKTSQITYMPKGESVEVVGDGWLKGEDVQKVGVEVPPPLPDPDPLPESDISDAELGYSLRVILTAARDILFG